MSEGPAALLKRNIDNAEFLMANVLADNDAAAFTHAAPQLTPQAFDYPVGQQ
jgi:hypothetical protein